MRLRQNSQQNPHVSGAARNVLHAFHSRSFLGRDFAADETNNRSSRIARVVEALSRV